MVSKRVLIHHHYRVLTWVKGRRGIVSNVAWHPPKRVPEKVIEEVKKVAEPEMWTCSVSVKTKDRHRVTDIDASVTVTGDRENALKELKKLMLDSCGYPYSYWDGATFMPGTAIECEAGFEGPKYGVKEEKVVVSCR